MPNGHVRDPVISRYLQSLDPESALSVSQRFIRDAYRPPTLERVGGNIASWLAGRGISAEVGLLGLERMAEEAVRVPGPHTPWAQGYLNAREIIRKAQGVEGSEEALRLMGNIQMEHPIAGMLGQIVGDMAQIGLTIQLMPQSTIFTAIQSIGSQEFGSPVEGLAKLTEMSGASEETKLGMRALADDPVTRVAFDSFLDTSLGRAIEGAIGLGRIGRTLGRAGQAGTPEFRAARRLGLGEAPAPISRENLLRGLSTGREQQALAIQSEITAQAQRRGTRPLARIREAERRVARREQDLFGIDREALERGIIQPARVAEGVGGVPEAPQRGIMAPEPPQAPLRAYDAEVARVERMPPREANEVSGYLLEDLEDDVLRRVISEEQAAPLRARLRARRVGARWSQSGRVRGTAFRRRGNGTPGSPRHDAKNQGAGGSGDPGQG
jgi:hypothetical protein